MWRFPLGHGRVLSLTFEGEGMWSPNGIYVVQFIHTQDPGGRGAGLPIHRWRPLERSAATMPAGSSLRSCITCQRIDGSESSSQSMVAWRLSVGVMAIDFRQRLYQPPAKGEPARNSSTSGRNLSSPWV